MLWIILIAILLIILFLPINIKIKFNNENRSKLVVKITLLKDLINLPVSFKNKDKNSSKNKEKNNYLDNIFLNKKYIIYFLKKSKVLQFKWTTIVGFNNAATTAISTGTLWSIKYNVVAFFFRDKPIEDFFINVVPEFNKNKFNTEVICIIKTKVVHIIIIGLWILIRNKGGERVVGTPNRRFNENNYG
ncbi:MAG TPA: DUF2953 domain-containing protein [Tissierellales bacterium]|nr:DUF2953 domain-containing protein [Tissierellales bacterium]